MSYSRVNWEDRIKIKLLLQQGKTNTEIAKLIRKTNQLLAGSLNVIAEGVGIVLSRRRDSQKPVKS